MATRSKLASVRQKRRPARAASPGLWLLLVAGGIAGCNAILGIEDGDVPSSENTGGSGGSGGTAAGAAGVGPGGASGAGAGGGAGASGAAGAGGVAVVCTGSETACGTRCVDLASASTDCGACDHDCGGGECLLGACQPVAVNLQAASVDAIGVGPTEIYFSTPASPDATTPPKLLACPKAGCTLAPRQLVAMGYGIGPIVYVPGTVVFESAPTQSTQRPTLYSCPEAGCESVPPSFASDGLNGFVGPTFAVGSRVFYNGGGIGLGSTTCGAGTCDDGASLGPKGLRALSGDATRLAFVDTTENGHRLATCDITNGACAATPLVAGDFSTVQATQIHDGTFYFMLPGREDFFEGKLQACSFADNCANVATLSNGLDFPTTLLVDDSGSYWFSRAAHKLQHCAPDTCTGGAKDLATAPAAPRSLTADDKFLYWIAGGAVFRVAKP
jgi:hypothetical protein